MTFANVKAFADKYIKNKTHTYVVLGDKKEIDFKVLEKYGKVKTLTLEEVFGYQEEECLKYLKLKVPKAKRRAAVINLAAALCFCFYTPLDDRQMYRSLSGPEAWFTNRVVFD